MAGKDVFAPTAAVLYSTAGAELRLSVPDAAWTKSVPEGMRAMWLDRLFVTWTISNVSTSNSNSFCLSAMGLDLNHKSALDNAMQ